MFQKYTSLGHYILFEKIATGGMAEIHLARSVNTQNSHKFFALKKILTGQENSEAIKSFKEEVKISKSLNHKNIVHFFDYFQGQKKMYIVMEYIDGKNLRQFGQDLRTTEKKLKTEYILHLVSEVALGLDHAHRSVDAETQTALNIVHRDINPLNIMIAFDGSIKIIDFGVARGDLRDEFTQVGLIKGKFSYMSPEQAEAKNIDGRSDLFALGIVLWELLTQKRLFENTDNAETLNQIRQGSIPSPKLFNPTLHPDLEKIVMKTLAKKPEDRFQSAADFQFALNQHLVVHYPQFRAYHFNDFVNKFYHLVIQERRDKLSKYAGHKVKSKTPSGRSVVEFTPLNQYDESQKQSTPRPELPEGFESRESTQTGAARFNIPAEADYKFENLNTNNLFSADVNPYTRPKAAAFYSQSNPAEEEGGPNELDFIYQIFNNSFVNQFKHLLLIFLFFYGVYTFFNYLMAADANLTQAIQPKPEPVTASEKTEVPAARQPSADDEFSKDVYRSLKANSQLAYIDIRVVDKNRFLNSSRFVKIYIDDKILYEKNPVHNYPIYANRLTKISAYDLQFKTYAERKVIIEPGKSLNLELKLMPYSSK